MQKILITILLIGLLACQNNAPSTKDPKQNTPVNNENYTGLDVKTHPNGKKKLEGNLYNGKRTGLWKSWFENGQLQSECEYSKGLKNGKYIIYQTNGLKKIIGEYAKDSATGIWTFFDDNGRPIKEINYRTGKTIDYK